MNVVLDQPPEAQRLQLLNDVWKVVMKLSSPEVSFGVGLKYTIFDQNFRRTKTFNTVLIVLRRAEWSNVTETVAVLFAE